MKNHFEKYRLVLILGFILVLVGITLLIAAISPAEDYSFLFFPSILLILGMIILYNALLGKRRLLPILIGLLLLSAWIFFLLVLAEVIPYTVTQVWPAMVILTGILIIPVGLIRYGYLPTTFILSTIFLCSLGITFLLFSLDIITMSFTKFASIWWPVLIIGSGIALICLFFYTRKNTKASWLKEIDEDEDLQ